MRAECARATAWLTSAGAPERFDARPFVDEGAGWPDAVGWLRGFLANRDLFDVEQQFSSAYVSNPWAGDLVLGHMLVMAELRLGTLSARAIRDPSAFSGIWTRSRREAHILARMGFGPPVLPLTCDHHGWSGGPWAFP